MAALPTQSTRLKSFLMSFTDDNPLIVPASAYAILEAMGLLNDADIKRRVIVQADLEKTGG